MKVVWRALVAAISLTLIMFGQVGAGAATGGITAHILLETKQIHPGQSATISGRVSPNHAGHAVALLRQTSTGHWQKVAGKTLNRHSRYRFSVRPSSVGVYTYRTLIVTGPRHVHTYSISVHLHVVRRQTSDCTPGYSPCIPTGSDVDCAGGSGDGPRYVQGPVYVTGSDPYGLDSDGDGVGCES